MEFYLQRLAPGVAGDLQRHRHESVHYVIEGEGHTEIGPETVRWQYRRSHLHPRRGCGTATTTTGHGTAARMLLVENSRLLESLGLNERESAGEIDYAQRPR